MTLKQRRLIQELAKNPKSSMLEIGEKAGYSKKSREVYRKHTKAHIEAFLSKGSLTAEDIEEAHREMVAISLKANDRTNASRNIEDLGRMKAVYTDKSEVKAEIISKEEQDILSKYNISNRLN